MLGQAPMALTVRICSRLYSTKAPSIDVASLLQTPSWSVHSLLSSATDSATSQPVTLKDIQHLSALSALPVPADQAASLDALRSHLHFVSTVRSVDTTGVRPLQSLRDETAAGEKAAEFGMQELQKALEGEEVVGKFHRRIRRKRTQIEQGGKVQFDILGMAERKAGRYFVVDRVVKESDGEEGKG